MFSSAICSVRVCKIDYFCCVLRARSKQMAVGRSGCAGWGCCGIKDVELRLDRRNAVGEWRE